jgi:hypothetical protein
MKLKLAELASIAEVIGALAIVISLIYVGYRSTTARVRPDFRAYIDEVLASGTTNTNLERLYRRDQE